MVYAIVRASGRQEKVSVGDTMVVNRVSGKTGDTVQFEPVLLVDGENITSDASKLAKVKVTAEIVSEAKGPKIVIHKFKNKTGYHKRQGHRQQLSRLKVTEIK